MEVARACFAGSFNMYFGSLYISKYNTNMYTSLSEMLYQDTLQAGNTYIFLNKTMLQARGVSMMKVKPCIITIMCKVMGCCDTHKFFGCD